MRFAGAIGEPRSRKDRRPGSEGTGVDTAVDQQVLSGYVGCLHAAQVGAQIAEFLGRAEAPCRNRLLQVPLDLLHGPALLLGVELGVALQPVGPEASGEQVVDGDVVSDGLARETGDEAGETAA